MLRVAAILALFLALAPGAWAQRPVYSGGQPITPGAPLVGVDPGHIGAGCTSAGGVGTCLGDIGIQGPLGLLDGPVNAPYHRGEFSWSNGTLNLDIEPFGGASAPSFQITINGTAYPFPAAGAGSGNMTGPGTSTVGHAVGFNNAAGSLTKDMGFFPAPGGSYNLVAPWPYAAGSPTTPWIATDPSGAPVSTAGTCSEGLNEILAAAAGTVSGGHSASVDISGSGGYIGTTSAGAILTNCTVVVPPGLQWRVTFHGVNVFPTVSGGAGIQFDSQEGLDWIGPTTVGCTNTSACVKFSPQSPNPVDGNTVIQASNIYFPQINILGGTGYGVEFDLSHASILENTGLTFGNIFGHNNGGGYAPTAIIVHGGTGSTLFGWNTIHATGGIDQWAGPAVSLCLDLAASCEWNEWHIHGVHPHGTSSTAALDTNATGDEYHVTASNEQGTFGYLAKFESGSEDNVLVGQQSGASQTAPVADISGNNNQWTHEGLHEYSANSVLCFGQTTGCTVLTNGNFAFSGNSTSTTINAPPSGTIYLKIGNGTAPLAIEGSGNSGAAFFGTAPVIQMSDPSLSWLGTEASAHTYASAEAAGIFQSKDTTGTGTWQWNNSDNSHALQLASNGGCAFGAPTGGVPGGAGTCNFAGLQINGVAVTAAGNTITLSGDTTGSGTASIPTTTGKVNGVSYPASPSTNTVPVVTSSNTVTYEAVPNAALANPQVTVAGHSISLGGSQALAIGDLSNIAAGTLVGNNTGSSAAPAASAAPVLGIAGSLSGTLGLAAAGGGGGIVTLSYFGSTTYAWDFPNGVGTAGQVLETLGGTSGTQWESLATVATSGHYADLTDKGTASISTSGTLAVTGGATFGSPTGGSLGANTLNAAALYQNNVPFPANGTPASSSAACTQGTFEADASYIYYCKGTNSWVRVATSSF